MLRQLFFLYRHELFPLIGTKKADDREVASSSPIIFMWLVVVGPDQVVDARTIQNFFFKSLCLMPSGPGVVQLIVPTWPIVEPKRYFRFYPKPMFETARRICSADSSAQSFSQVLLLWQLILRIARHD